MSICITNSFPWVPGLTIFQSSFRPADKKIHDTTFSIIADPFEEVNLAPEQPHLVEMLTKRLDHYKASMMEPHITDQVARGNPNKFGGIWSTGWCSPSNDEVQIVVV